MPRLFGQTEAARAAKARPAKRSWDRERLAMLVANNDEKVAMTAERIFAWADAHQPPLHQTYGSGPPSPAATWASRMRRHGACRSPSTTEATRRVEIQFGLMTTVPLPAV